MLSLMTSKSFCSLIIYELVFAAGILSQDGLKGSLKKTIMEQCIDSRKCMCDAACHINNDCCDFISNSTQYDLKMLPGSSFDCVSTIQAISNTDMKHVGKYFLATASCPKDSAIPRDLVEGCEASKLGNQYVAEMIKLHENGFNWLRRNLKVIAPVVEFRTGRIFGNIDCAICNNVFGSYQKDTSISLQNVNLIISPLKVYCTKMEVMEHECFVNPQLPEGFYRHCTFMHPRSMFDANRLIGMDEIFLIPNEYFDRDYIELPLDQVDKNRTSSNSTIDKDEFSNVSIWLQIILSIFSIIGLSIMLYVYSKHSKLRRSLAGHLSIGLAVGLLLAQFSFLFASIVVPSIGNRGFCVSTATLLLFSLLCSFTWMALFACQLLETFGNFEFCKTAVINTILCRCSDATMEPNSGNQTTLLHSRNYHDDDVSSKFLKFLIAAISIPLCLTVPALIINEYVFVNYSTKNASNAKHKISNATTIPFYLEKMNPGICIDDERAWFSSQSGLIIWFLCPAAIMISFNMVALLVVSLQICLLSRSTELPSSPDCLSAENRQNTSRSLVIICTKLSVILGVSWFIQFFASWWPALGVLRQVAALFNCAQGGVIALAMLLSSNTRRVLGKWMCGFCLQIQCCRRKLMHPSSSDTYDMMTVSSRLSAKKVDHAS